MKSQINLRIMPGAFAAGIVICLWMLPLVKAQPLSERGMWDVQFALEMQEIQKAITYGNSTFYMARAFSSDIVMFDEAGNQTGTFTIPEIPTFNDLEWDGTYLYALSNTTLLYQIDPVTQTLVGTLQIPMPAPRIMAWEIQQDAFWIGDWTGNLYLVTRDGMITANYLTMEPVIDLEYDDHNDGHYLWFLANDGSGSRYFQVDMNTGMPTGNEHFIWEEFGYENQVSGMYISTGIVGESTTIGSILHSTPPQYFGYELYGATSAIFDENPVSVTVMPNPAGDFIRIKSDQPVLEVKLLDRHGRVVFAGFPKTVEFTIEIPPFNAGVFILQIETVNGTAHEKIFVR